MDAFTLDDIAPVHIVLWAGTSIPDDAAARSQYNALARRVAGKPEHPDRAALETLHRALITGGQSARIELFIGGDMLVRECNTYPGDGTAFYDTIFTPDDAWSITPDRITRVRPSRGFPRESDFSGTPTNVWHMAGFVATGGLHLMALHRGRVMEVRESGRTFLAVVQSQDGAYTSRIELNWDPDIRQGRVRSQEMWLTKSGDSAGAWTMGDQQYHDALGRWITTSWVEQSSPGGVPVQWKVDLTERIARQDLRSALRCPTRDSPDAVRGPVPLLIDFRDDLRGRAAGLMPGVEIPEGRLPIPPHFARARWLAAGAAICVAAFLIVLRLRRSPM